MGRVTSNKYGEKGRRTVKPKSIKTKSIHLSSTRKLARMGKDQKKGHSGSAASYYTRSQALRKLQITLRDFRRLCILRGIYPREPKKLPKRGVHNHTYYHKKDIAYLAYEPLLDKFRAFKSFMKKVRKAAGRGNHARARAMHEEDKPEYSLDHIIRDRFPTFVDAVADVDDALCMVHLFATLPAKGRVSPEVTAAARRQAREWQLWCCHAQVLRKVFLSVKGIYYQAEIMGQKVTWLVPYAFTQEVQSEVDFRVMSTFFEFYQTFLGFVLFRLYHESAMAYPPTLSDMLDRAGLHLGALSLREESAAPLDDGAAEVEESASAAAKPTGSIDDSESFVVDEKAQKARLASLSDALSSIDGADDGATAKAAKKKAAKAKSTEEDATFAASEEAVALKEKDAAKNALTTLFDGLCIFVSRETPVESLEFVIRSFGGTVAFDGDGSPCDESDARITHHIVDRPKLRRRFDGRECVLISVLISVYVQPQWIYDSVNAQLLLPCAWYAHGATLPPHLSPFVDNEAVGYTPTFAKRIEAVRRGVNPADMRGALADGEEEEEEDDGAVAESAEQLYNRELAEEQAKAGSAAAGTSGRKKKRKRAKGSKKAAAADLAADQKEMAESMMPRKIKRLHGRIVAAEQKKGNASKRLEKKRRKLEGKK